MNRTTQLVLSAVVLVVGVLLMAMMIYVESEPGGIPLLLIATGAGWHVFARTRKQPTHDRLG